LKTDFLRKFVNITSNKEVIRLAGKWKCGECNHLNPMSAGSCQGCGFGGRDCDSAISAWEMEALEEESVSNGTSVPSDRAYDYDFDGYLIEAPTYFA